MDKMPLLAVLFNSIPEGVILFSFGIAIVGERINVQKVIIAAIIDAFAMMLVRWFVPYFGVHSLIGLLVLFVLFRTILGIEAWKAMISSLLSLTVLILLDNFIISAILNLTQITFTESLQDDVRRIVYAYPSLALFGLITWTIYYKKWFLIKGGRVSNVEYIKDKMREPLLLTTIILFQGIVLVFLNEYFVYKNNESLTIKMLNLIYFTLSIVVLKHVWSIKDKMDALLRELEIDKDERLNFGTFDSSDFK